MANERLIETPASSDLATFTLKVDGEEVDRTFQVMSVVVSKELNRIPSAKIMLLDGDPSTGEFNASSSELFVPGNSLEILAGYHSDESPIFKGTIIKQNIRIRQSGGAKLILECKDPVFKMTMGRKSKYFYEAKDSGAMEEIIDEYGFEKEIEDTTTTHKEIVQFDITDWDFLVSRADINGMFCFVEDNKVIIKSPDTGQEPKLTVQYGASLLEFDSEIDARHQVLNVKASAWNQADQEVSEAESSEPEVPSSGNLSPTDLADSIGSDTYQMIHGGNVSEEILQKWADAKLQRNRLAKIRGRAKFQGTAEVTPGDMIEVQGLGDRINGLLFVSGVAQNIMDGKWETDVQFGINPEWFSETYPVHNTGAYNLSPLVSGLQIGVVTRLEGDPESEDRILVKLPLINPDEEGVWSRLATLDAGDGRGMFFRPEIGDEVVVGFLNDDPKHPVVLGMLHSSAKPTPEEITDDNHIKGYVSRSELKIVVDDEKKSFTFETPAGNTFIMDEDAGSITLEDQNGNKLVMDSNGITMESAKDLTFKASGDIKTEGTNITHSANASMKAEGSAGAELSSGATVKIQGSLVQIN